MNFHEFSAVFICLCQLIGLGDAQRIDLVIDIVIEKVSKTTKALNSKYSYHKNDSLGPSKWGKMFPSCNGKRQSPIDIDWTQASFVDSSRKLHINGWSKRPQMIRIENNGKSATFTMGFADGVPPNITGGPLGNDVYILSDFHLHWDKSEHTYNRARFAAELHLVHYNSKYKSLTKALTMDDGLAVLGIVFASSTQTTSKLPFTRFLKAVREPNTKYVDHKNVFSYGDLIKQQNFTIASYKGSLTTPPCYESVTWMLSSSLLSISQKELKELQMLRDSDGKYWNKNWRPTQKINGRKLKMFKH